MPNQNAAMLAFRIKCAVQGTEVSEVGLTLQKSINPRDLERMQAEIMHAKQFFKDHAQFLEQTMELIKKFMVNKEQFIFANRKHARPYPFRPRQRLSRDLREPQSRRLQLRRLRLPQQQAVAQGKRNKAL